jgi:hypothetical protein
MGHLPIVSLQTVENVINNGYISTRGDLKTQIIKTISDIFSDVLATRKNDLVFPWIVRSDISENIGFKYVFQIAGSPIFIKNDRYPVKVPLKEEGYEFEIPVSEAEALDLWESELLWNAIGKKSLGRGRSLSHQLPMEDNRLYDLLKKKNPRGPKKIKLANPTLKGQPITINPIQDSWDPKLDTLIRSLPAESRISKLDLNGLPWRRDDKFIYEKTLEAWLMENIDSPKSKQFQEKALVGGALEWFGNYLPFGVAGGNMDVVAIETVKNEKIISIIELKVGELNQAQYFNAAHQVLEYTHFISRAFNAYGMTIKTNPTVICAKPERVRGYAPLVVSGTTVKLITYDIIANGDVNFVRMA